MPSQTASVAPERKEYSSLFNSMAADVGGGLLALGAGIGTAAKIINFSFFSNAEKDGRFIDLAEKRDRERAAMRDVSGEKWVQNVAEIEKEYTHGLKTRLQELHLDSPWKRWRSLRNHQKTEVALAVAAVTAVTMGAVTAFFGNRDLDRKLNEVRHRLNEREQNQQRSP